MGSNGFRNSPICNVVFVDQQRFHAVLLSKETYRWAEKVIFQLVLRLLHVIGYFPKLVSILTVVSLA